MDTHSSSSTKHLHCRFVGIHIDTHLLKCLHDLLKILRIDIIEVERYPAIVYGGMDLVLGIGRYQFGDLRRFRPYTVSGRARQVYRGSVEGKTGDKSTVGQPVSSPWVNKVIDTHASLTVQRFSRGFCYILEF